MKFRADDLRYLTADEFRLLTATEMGSKNHEVVPASLIASISGIRSGISNKLMGQLAKRNLIARVQNIKYDGYRLTYGGYDFLALRAMSKRDSVAAVGNQIGVGKESDIHITQDKDGVSQCLKLHRLGRISFRAIKEKRDYMGKRKSASWMYMSRLAAHKEWAFLNVLHEAGFPVPTPIDHSRHAILMSLIDAYPLRQLAEHDAPGELYAELMALIVRFARAGLVHGDFNEFNLLIGREEGEVVVIDFPQCVSTSHPDAEWFFNRDVACIRTFFRRRFRYETPYYPRFKASLADESVPRFELDVAVEASGWGANDEGKLRKLMSEEQKHAADDREDAGGSGSSDEDESEEDDDDDDDESGDESGDEEEEDDDGQVDEADEQGETREQEMARLMREASADVPPTLVASTSAAPASRSRASDNDEDDEAEDDLAPLPSSAAHPPSPTSMPVLASAFQKVSFTTRPPPSVAPSSRSLLPGSEDIRTTVSSEMVRQRAQTAAKHHSRVAPGKMGGAKGTKKKNEGKARLMKQERSGANDDW